MGAYFLGGFYEKIKIIRKLFFKRRDCVVVVCFVAFLVNDIYGFISWRKMENKQAITCNQITPSRQLPVERAD